MIAFLRLRYRVRFFFLATMSAIVAAFCVIWWLKDSGLPHLSSEENIQIQRIETASTVDLGIKQNGELVQAAIELRNSSSTAVSVGKFRTGCSCMTVYRLDGNVRRSVQELVIPGGEHRTVYLDVRITGEPGRRYTTAVYFQDLQAEIGEFQVSIVYTPITRIYTIPQNIVFDSIQVGSVATRRVEVRSDGSYQEDLRGLSISKPEIYSMTTVYPTVEEQARFADTFKGQHLVGFLDISIRPQSGENRSDELFITNHGTEFVRLNSSVQAVTPFSAAPSRLTLPRTENGKNSYSARLMIRSRTDTAFSVKPMIEELPFVTTVTPSDDRKTASVAVSYSGSIPVKEIKDFMLRFQITPEGGSTYEILVPVKMFLDE